MYAQLLRRGRARRYHGQHRELSHSAESRLTREELQKAEEPKFRFFRDYLRTELLSPNIDRSMVGWLRLQDGVFWLALHREPQGAGEFLEAALHYLGMHTRECNDVPPDVPSLFACFRTRVGLFLAAMLSGSNGDWSDFESALGFLSRSWDVSGPETDPDLSTPITLFTAALAALGALHGHPAPASLVERSRTDPVTAHFRNLRGTLVAVIDDPDAARCNEVRKAYRAAISISDYRDAIVRGLLFQHLLAISAVAECGDFMKGALEIFE